MANSPRLYVGLAILVALMVAIAVLGSRGGDTSTTEPLPPKAGVNRIAYVSLDGQVRTIRPDGSDERRISPEELSPEDGFFTWPTWSQTRVGWSSPVYIAMRCGAP